jgi:hypothetical protein
VDIKLRRKYFNLRQTSEWRKLRKRAVAQCLVFTQYLQAGETKGLRWEGHVARTDKRKRHKMWQDRFMLEAKRIRQTNFSNRLRKDGRNPMMSMTNLQTRGRKHPADPT